MALPNAAAPQRWAAPPQRTGGLRAAEASDGARGLACRHLVLRERSRTVRRFGSAVAGNMKKVFLFFSNRLGCLGSLLVSAVLTIVLVLVIRLVLG